MYMLIVLLDLLPVLLHLTINSRSVFCFQHLVYSWYRAGSQRKAVSESQLSFAPWIPMPHICMGFPSGSVVKNPPANAGDVRDAGLIPGLGRSPGGGHGNPLQYFFFLIFFWCGPFLKSLLNLSEYYFCFMFWFSGCKAYGILAPWPGTEPAPLASEGEVLTTRPAGKSLLGTF